MSDKTPGCIVFDERQLLPESWRKLLRDEPLRTFNPGLLRDGEGWIFAYRVVGADGLRRIALCRLDASLRIVEGSACALSDELRFAAGAHYPEIVTQWFADPRLYRLQGRVFVYWNSGWHEPRNHQFLQELDPKTLRPLGCARELVLRGERRKLEKNWTFFETADAKFFAVYSITPHRVLSFEIGHEGDVMFEPTTEYEWSITGYPANHGGLRGGAPPVYADGEFWSFCHSVHDGPSGYRYAAAVYRFAAALPFAPTARPTLPLELAASFASRRAYPRLNPAVDEVIYPCGAAYDGTRWLISHGINDERCAVSILTPAEVSAALLPRAAAG